MAYTTINKSSEYFNTKLYTGNGSTQSITGVNFTPDWTWIKQRNGTNYHTVFDIVRGATKRIFPNATDAEDTAGSTLTSFDSDGFTLDANAGVNGTGNTFVSWNWLAGGTASSNTDGSITSQVSANTTSGFSIVKYNSTRTPSAVQTVGHGLGVTPDVLIFKNLNETQNWLVWHKDIATDKHLNLNTTSALLTDAGSLNNTAPTSSVFTIGADGRTNSTTEGNPIICYAFAEKKGFSRFGSYTGNGSTDGTFVYTGFKPAFLMVKRTNSAENWYIKDIKRSVFNPVDEALYANGSNAELTNWGGATTDYLSNGFKIRTTDTAHNGSGDTYIYMAFAENPLVGTNNIPATAR